VWTIGYGHTRNVHDGMTCTQQQAPQWLLEDTAAAVQNVNTHVKVPLTQAEFDALVDFDFNCGSGSLDSSALLKLVNQSEPENAAKEFQRRDHGRGKVVAGLLRRQAEEQEFLTV
jgi:lysozyme